MACCLMWWHQAITWTKVDFSLARFCGIFLRAILQVLFCIMSLKFIISKLLPHLPGANKYLSPWYHNFNWILRYQYNTVQYSTVQYNKILHAALQWLGQIINHSMNPQKTAHILPFCVRYRMAIWRILERIEIYNGTVLYRLCCILLNIARNFLCQAVQWYTGFMAFLPQKNCHVIWTQFCSCHLCKSGIIFLRIFLLIPGKIVIIRILLEHMHRKCIDMDSCRFYLW